MDRLQIVTILIFVSRCNLGYSNSTELPSTTPIMTTPTSTLMTETSTMTTTPISTTCGAPTCTTTPTTTTCVNLCTTTTPTTTTQTTTKTTTTTTPMSVTHTTAPTTTPTTTPTMTTMMTTPTRTTCRETICTTTTPLTTTSTMTTPIMTPPISTTTCEYICTTTTPTTTTQTTTKTTTTITPTIPPTTTTTPMTTTPVVITPTTTPVATTTASTPVENTPTTTPVTTVKTSTTPTTKTEPTTTTPFTTTPMDCHIPPSYDCCIRKQLRISLKHVPVVFGKVPYISVMEQTIGKDMSGCDAKILLNATFQKNNVFDNCQSCTRVPKCGRKMLRIDLEMAPNKTGFSFHVGDSRTNNGYKGDASTQENDAEFHFLGYQHLLYGSDKCPNMSLIMTGLLRNGVTSVTIFIGNEFIRVFNNHGYVYEICSQCLFSLNGQSDSQGPVNENIFIGLNRIIDSSSYRDGTGVCSAVIRWACPWDC